MSKRDIIEVVNTPLGFFVLALLIVESLLGSTFFSDSFSDDNKMICIWIGVALFVVVVLIVLLLVWQKPENLTFDNRSHLMSKGIFGTSDDPLTEKNVKNIEKSSPDGGVK